MDNRITKSITINAPAITVWNVLTKPPLMKQWLSDSEVDVFSDETEGGQIRFSGKLHKIRYEGKGTILQFDPGRHFSYTHWDKLSRLADIPQNYSVIHFTLEESDDVTTLTLTQSNLVTDVILKHFNFYWNSALMLIKRLSEQ